MTIVSKGKFLFSAAYKQETVKLGSLSSKQILSATPVPVGDRRDVVALGSSEGDIWLWAGPGTPEPKDASLTTGAHNKGPILALAFFTSGGNGYIASGSRPIDNYTVKLWSISR